MSSLTIVLDVALGLILTYLLLGLLASAFQEFCVGIVKLRGRKLFAALDQLLKTEPPVEVDPPPADASAPVPLAEQVKQHALLKPTGAEKPSYIPAKNFAMALIDVLAGKGVGPIFSQVEQAVATLPNGSAKTALTTFVKRAGGDVDALQQDIETWFDDAMDRVSGEYKRFSHYFLLVFGFVLAVGLNVDSILIASTLWQDPVVRSQVVAAAVATAAGKDANDLKNVPSSSPANGDKSTAAPACTHGSAANTADAASTPNEQCARAVDALEQLEKLPLPIGWQAKEPAMTSSSNIPLNPLLRLIGWLLTAFGVSMGAPFWFNVLQQAVSLRAAGPKPLRADAS